MAETYIEETPVKRDWAMQLAKALRGARDFANNAAVPDSVPYVGGMKLGDTLMGQSPEGAERLAYGERMMSGKGQTLAIRPETLDLAMMVPTNAIGKGAVMAAKPLEKASGESIVKALRTPKIKQTVDDPQRIAYPGIYDRPDVIAREAEAKVAPESPLLKQLFGVTRDDLYEMSKRSGNESGVIPGAAKNPKGSAAAEGVMNRRNENRLLDVISELRGNSPELWKGMHAWYTMDPQYHKMVELLGPEEGAKAYHRLNTFGGIESPNMPVPIEFQRASAANWLANTGRWDDWKKFGGLRDEERQLVAPADMMALKGRVGHERASTSQEKFLNTGEHGMESPKAPPYIKASSVPELGFQTDLPVGDAHWSRAVGLADTRTNKAFDASVETPELQQLAPWFRNRIANKAGLEAVPAQAILWGGFSPRTGVKTAIGAPKLELHAIEIGKAAERMGISPEKARDLILSGRAHAGLVGSDMAGADAVKAVANDARSAAISALRQKSKRKDDEE